MPLSLSVSHEKLCRKLRVENIFDNALAFIVAVQNTCVLHTHTHTIARERENPELLAGRWDKNMVMNSLFPKTANQKLTKLLGVAC